MSFDNVAKIKTIRTIARKYLPWLLLVFAYIYALYFVKYNY